MTYTIGSHTVFHNRYHLVWITKYRYKVLTTDMRLRIRDITYQVCEQLGVKIVKGVLSRNHIHMFVEIPPKLSVSDFMRRVKGCTSRKVQQEFPELRKRYLGRRFWARGYFCTTSGNVTNETILNYIESHTPNEPSVVVQSRSASPLNHKLKTLMVPHWSYNSLQRKLLNFKSIRSLYAEICDEAFNGGGKKQGAKKSAAFIGQILGHQINTIKAAQAYLQFTFDERDIQRCVIAFSIHTPALGEKPLYDFEEMYLRAEEAS